MIENQKKLSTDPYKGVRDFFPPDMAVEKHIFTIWRSVCEKYGYEEYAASVLEPAELYRAKSGEEIVNEQTYTFTDRGEREVTLRPEMTPTVARMVASRKRELVFPLRWYSIPNLFRYEQPQRGRVREHWQLNVDIFGVESNLAEIEVIGMASDIVRAYGLKNSDFEIRLNNRKLVNYVTREVFGMDESAATAISKLIDKKDKLSPEAFKETAEKIFAGVTSATPQKLGVSDFLILINSQNLIEFASHLPQTGDEHAGIKEIKEVMAGLEKLGVTNVRFDQTLMRGFDYYTGIVFEIFDLNPANRRSVFGGGRYDDLLALFGNEKVSAFGFGAGDVIARDLMETYGTLPTDSAPAQATICVIGTNNMPHAFDVARSLRSYGLRISIDISGKKIGDQISQAGKRGILNVIIIGDEEATSGKLKVKTLATQAESVLQLSEVAAFLNVNKA